MTLFLFVTTTSSYFTNLSPLPSLSYTTTSLCSDACTHRFTITTLNIMYFSSFPNFLRTWSTLTEHLPTVPLQNSCSFTVSFPVYQASLYIWPGVSVQVKSRVVFPEEIFIKGAGARLTSQMVITLTLRLFLPQGERL